jgi:hypothetical protein
MLQVFQQAKAAMPAFLLGADVSPFQAGYQDALDCVGSYVGQFAAGADQAEYEAGYAFGAAELN